ncbi:MAG: hypothetical protein LBQ15_07700 [Clostridium sp.]|jgi:hypothetical protein|nr:hypothetical protein [Clostridium sp.]
MAGLNITAAPNAKRLTWPGSAASVVSDPLFLGSARIWPAVLSQLLAVSRTVQYLHRSQYSECFFAGVEKSAAIDKIVDGAVEAAVLDLGHSEAATAANWEDYSGGTE